MEPTEPKPASLGTAGTKEKILQGIEMNIETYDCEVYAYDWIVVFKNKETGLYTAFHNDGEGLKDFIDSETVYIGFNTKNYDQHIIKAICTGLPPEEVKTVNDWIIGGGAGWECPSLQGCHFRFNNVDIRDDVQMGLSLKAIEGHLGMSIEETEIPFDLDRPLTPQEVKQVIAYCMHDVDATETLCRVRSDYLQTKINLGQRVGIPPAEAMAMTNAKLTARMLNAVRQEWNDGRDYVFPPHLDLTVIPKEVLDFFETIHDKSIPDDVLFKTALEINIGDLPCKFAWGGVHGSVTGYYGESNEHRMIVNKDVMSLYPSLIEKYNYLSRNVPDPELFYTLRRDRIEAKKRGDKKTAKDLKLPLNTVSGAQDNKYNDLYDPLPTRSLRISGQLFLTMLVMRMLSACKSIKLLNLNTDGIMYEIDRSEGDIADRVASEWEQQTGFELETDDIAQVWIKDVNNLLIIMTNGDIKTCGGYLNYDVSVKGAWAINNNVTIVKKAIAEYFVHHTPVETTIGNCTNILEFQQIAKAGTKYKDAFQIIDGETHPVQMVNRVYATKDPRYGRLYKVKAENDMTAKIEMLPEHCIIDNDNKLTIDAIDKDFYIQMAKKRINDFIGGITMPEKETVKTAPKTKNVYQKLAEARVEFLASNAKKSGKNTHLAFTYFELDDIVPIAEKIFAELGLFAHVSFDETTALMTVIDTDDPAGTIAFRLPFEKLTGNSAVNPVQALGASVTYYRRYLYMNALDICEPDNIEPMLGTESPEIKPKITPAPAAPAEEAPQSLTDSGANASDLQIAQLKKLFKALLEKDGSKEEMVSKIATETKGFTVLSKSDCEALTVKVSQMLEAQ